MFLQGDKEVQTDCHKLSNEIQVWWKIVQKLSLYNAENY